MTDNEIVKALKCCSTDGRTCKKCPYDGQTTDKIFCDELVMRDALTLINSLYTEIGKLLQDVTTYRLRWAKATAKLDTAEAEIEKLKEDNEALNSAISSALDIVNSNYQIGRTDGIKEFVERLKGKDGNEFIKSAYEGKDEIYWFDQPEYESFVDNLGKELVGADNAERT